MNFGPGVSPQGQKVKSDNALDGREPRVANGPVTAIGIWGYTPVRITGVLVFIIFKPGNIAQNTIIDRQTETPMNLPRL